MGPPAARYVAACRRPLPRTERAVPQRRSRRDFLKRSAVAAGVGLSVPYFHTLTSRAEEAKNDRFTVAAIGVGGRGRGIGNQLRQRGDCVAVCDVDRHHAERFRGEDSNIQIYEDHRELLDRQDIDLVTIGTPDHWHAPILLDALQAGKDVYCEKPLTLTIDEGKLLCRAVEQSGRIVQVGTQQRTEFEQRFLQAVALVRSGRLGKIKKLTVGIGGSPLGGPFEVKTPPDYFNWDRWLGQTPAVDYIAERTHSHFRWWYEYSGGKVTDWGAHHVDIAQWALGLENTTAHTIEPLSVTHPVEFRDGFPTESNRFNAANAFKIRCLYPGDIEMILQDEENGILFEGEKGRIFVNRGRVSGKPFEEIFGDEEKQIPRDEEKVAELEEQVHTLFGGREPKGHMDNFLDAVKDRELPISDVFTHHRALTTCHLANIAIRLGRTLRWDGDTESVVEDDQVNELWLKRPQREGYQFG
ncbi:MAG: gfo/Idh/MocA family oxidoreductase [Planctomycetota bacterium]|nr:MAG: gfo/Idh/MocA family oxidoreductase [Planctomycetota bacterium]REK46013.1 MAG: gfo/Idh/MocA family oxidoreductase [Planctomycetota bacterium]